MPTPLTLTTRAMARMNAIVQASGPSECLGLMASQPGCVPVSAIAMLPGPASPVHAEASPLSVQRAAAALADAGLVPRGLWHSHGHGRVFHSGTDLDTIHRLLPAMAEANFERGLPVRVPAVLGPDTAVLPLADGRLLTFTLCGAPVRGSAFHAPAAWRGIATTWVPMDTGPASELTGCDLRVSAGGVSLRLGLPPGASVTAVVTEPAVARVARLYSLVVNTDGQRDARCLVVTDSGDERATRLIDCPVAVASDGDDACFPVLLW